MRLVTCSRAPRPAALGPDPPVLPTQSTYAWRDTDARLVTGHSRGNPARPPSRDFANRLFQYAQKAGKPLASFTHDDIVAPMASLKPSPAPLPNFIIPNAAGSMLTTLADYTAFLRHVLSADAELTPKTLQLILSRATPINSAISWGLGWGLERAADRDYLWHWGDNGTYRNFVLAHRPSQTAIVVFTNGSNGMRIAERAVAAASGHEHPAFDWL